MDIAVPEHAHLVYYMPLYNASIIFNFFDVFSLFPINKIALFQGFAETSIVHLS